MIHWIVSLFCNHKWQITNLGNYTTHYSHSLWGDNPYTVNETKFSATCQKCSKHQVYFS